MNEEHDDEREVIARLHDLHRSVVRWLGVVILVAVVGIVSIAFLDSSVYDFITGEGEAEGPGGVITGLGSRGTQTDQAVAILGNIAAAGIGALAGWITRDFTMRYRGLKISSPREDGDE